MKFKSIEEAKVELIEAIIAQHIALLNRDDDTQEKNIKKAFKIDKYIKDNFDLRQMKDLLEHEDLGVRSWVANMLLPIYEDISLEILDQIYKKNIRFISMGARAMYCKWKRIPITFG